MDRRKFLTRSAAVAVGTTAIPTGVNSAATAIDHLADDDLFRGLSAVVGHTTDEAHRNYIRELIAAKEWARQRGIRFEWKLTSEINPDADEQLGCVCGYLGNTLVARGDGFTAGILDASDRDHYQREECECELARSLMRGEKSNHRAGRAICNMAGIGDEELKNQFEIVYLNTYMGDKPWRQVSERDDVYHELFRIVDRDTNDDGTPVSDRIHRLKILALTMAKEWADDAGITFQWSPETPHVTCQRCGMQYESKCPKHPEWGVDRHERTWRCEARLGADPLAWEGDWYFGDEPPSDEYLEDAAAKLWCEGKLSQLFMEQLADGASRDELPNAHFQDGPDGRLVFVE